MAAKTSTMRIQMWPDNTEKLLEVQNRLNDSPTAIVNKIFNNMNPDDVVSLYIKSLPRPVEKEERDGK